MCERERVCVCVCVCVFACIDQYNLCINDIHSLRYLDIFLFFIFSASVNALYKLYQ